MKLFSTSQKNKLKSIFIQIEYISRLIHLPFKTKKLKITA